jgi:AcrR family transcriptional regulator
MYFSLSKFDPRIHPSIFLKDPLSSELGRKILRHSVELIEEVGFEDFNFRKLGRLIQSPEASIYRYFDNKHKLLLYLSSWYWGWIEYRLAFRNANIVDPILRLENAIEILTNPSSEFDVTEYLNTNKLFKIIYSESSKAYLIKDVDALNQDGMYFNYKHLVASISNIIREIVPDYPYPHMLTTTVIEGIHHQIFFSLHLKSLTDKKEGEHSILIFYKNLILKQLNVI